MRRLSGALTGVLLALAACGGQPQPSVTASSNAEPTPVESIANPSTVPTPSATVATPAEVPKGQQFKLDDGAEFDDGLVIEIATVADKAAKTDRGAEATKGEIVIASVRIKNNTKKPYDAKGVLIGAKYGDDNQDAQIIIDKTDELQSGFKGKIKPKDESIATIGFAVPWKELTKVTFIVDPNDDVHEVISFTGRVHRA
jgi:hypothetical protein